MNLKGRLCRILTKQILGLIFVIKFRIVYFNILPKEEEIPKIVNNLNPNKAYTSEVQLC